MAPARTCRVHQRTAKGTRRTHRSRPVRQKHGRLFHTALPSPKVRKFPNVGLAGCLQAVGGECGLLATFGERQIIAQPVARRLLVSPLFKKDFRDGYQLLARGDFASGNLNHQKGPRAECGLLAEWHEVKLQYTVVSRLCMPLSMVGVAASRLGPACDGMGFHTWPRPPLHRWGIRPTREASPLL
jgi:hypothetical protein